MAVEAASLAGLKQAMRVAALGRRDRLEPAYRADASAAVAERAFSFLSAYEPGIVSAYWPIRSELDPGPLVDKLRHAHVEVALPVLVDAETMRFRHWQAGIALVPAGFGTVGPPAGAAEERPDVLLVPLAAFDRRGFRIGYGKGHYDRAVAAFHAEAHRPLLVGLAFATQEVDNVPAEAHDVPLDAIVTEDEVIAPART